MQQHSPEVPKLSLHARERIQNTPLRNLFVVISCILFAYDLLFVAIRVISDNKLSTRGY